MTHRERRRTLSAPRTDYLGHGRTRKEKGRGTLQTSTLPLGNCAGGSVGSPATARSSSLPRLAKRAGPHSPGDRPRLLKLCYRSEYVAVLHDGTTLKVSRRSRKALELRLGRKL